MFGGKYRHSSFSSRALSQHARSVHFLWLADWKELAYIFPLYSIKKIAEVNAEVPYWLPTDLSAKPHQ